jgi:hypothetical protein
MSEPRPKSYEMENENMKANDPPHPETEPAGSEGSSDSQKTRSDPATGEPH